MKVDEQYFQNRELKRHVGPWSLWALGVGTMISYIMQMLSFLLLRRKYPQMDRPYVSSLGNWGAIAALIISVVTLVFLFINPDYRPGIYGCALWFFCGILYFYFWGRKVLVKSPEEEFALGELARG